MASVATRCSIIRWVSYQFINRRAGFHSRPTNSDVKVPSKSVLLSCSRRNSIINNKYTRGIERRPFREFSSAKISNERFLVSGIVVGACTIITGFLYYLKTKSWDVVNIQHTLSLSTVSAASADNPLLPPSQRFNFIADVVEKAAPAVVYIELKDRHAFSGRMVTVSNGSGFVVRGDGLIVTNAHVVANKAVVKVRLFDGRELDGWVVAVDPVSDLAAVKVNATGLPVLRMGLSSKLRAGEWVVAMGSPLSLSNTVTCGIVSSVNRGSKELGIRNKDMEYIQTDALINFGNSGGPLVNLDGEVIGINTMKVTPGISFAIPSDYASNFLTKVDEVLSRGQPKKRQWFNMGSDSARRRFIGITMLTLNSQLMMELKNRLPEFPDISGGVLVHKIIVGSPAYNGGLRAGDIITEINGKPALTSADVYHLVEASETLTVIAYRGHQKMKFYVTSEEVN